MMRSKSPNIRQNIEIDDNSLDDFEVIDERCNNEQENLQSQQRYIMYCSSNSLMLNQINQNHYFEYLQNFEDEFMKNRKVQVSLAQVNKEFVINNQFYLIETYQIIEDKQKNTTKIEKRFNQFNNFFEKLKQDCVGVILPPLPEKDVRSKINLIDQRNQQFIEQRAYRLQIFLQNLLDHKELRYLKSLRSFLDPGSQEDELNDPSLVGQKSMIQIISNVLFNWIPNNRGNNDRGHRDTDDIYFDKQKEIISQNLKKSFNNFFQIFKNNSKSQHNISCQIIDNLEQFIKDNQSKFQKYEQNKYKEIGKNNEEFKVFQEKRNKLSIKQNYLKINEIYRYFDNCRWLDSSIDYFNQRENLSIEKKKLQYEMNSAKNDENKFSIIQQKYKEKNEEYKRKLIILDFIRIFKLDLEEMNNTINNNWQIFFESLLEMDRDLANQFKSLQNFDIRL